MSTKHTSGPWEIDTDRTILMKCPGPCRLGGPPEHCIHGIAEIFSWMGRQEADANAHLIAAAPELLESAELDQKAWDALWAELGNFPRSEALNALVFQAQAARKKAVSKAEGR